MINPAEEGDLLNILLVALGIRAPCCLPDLVATIPWEGVNWMEIPSIEQEFVMDVFDECLDARSSAPLDRLQVEWLSFGEAERQEMKEAYELWHDSCLDAYRQRWPTLFWRELLENRAPAVAQKLTGSLKCAGGFPGLRVFNSKQLNDDEGEVRTYVCLESNVAMVHAALQTAKVSFRDSPEGSAPGGHLDWKGSAKLLGYPFPVDQTVPEFPEAVLSFGPGVTWIKHRAPLREFASNYKLWTVTQIDKAWKKAENADKWDALHKFIARAGYIGNCLCEDNEIESKPLWWLWTDY